MMKASDYIIRFLEQKKIHHVFGYIGGAIVNLIHSMKQNRHVHFIQNYHEQNAAFAAEGYARFSNNMGVAMATSGPGATNLITGIADAYFDSIPVLYITGQVNTFEYKKEKPVRQQGFQETDIVSIVKPITKYAVLLDDPKMIRYELEKACFLTKDSRPGPVLLDIPMDVQRAEIDPDKLMGFVPPPWESRPALASGELEKIIEAMKNAKRPLILAGGGCQNPDTRKSLLAFSHKFKIPVVTSLMGKGVIPEDDESYAGFIGSYGNRSANIITANADLLIALGTRLDTRQTGTRLTSFLREGRIIHVDIDEYEIRYNRIKRDFTVLSDVREFLTLITGSLQRPEADIEWQKYIQDIRTQYSQENEIKKNITNRMPYDIMTLLSEVAADNQIFCCDIGHNQMFAAQMLKIRKNQSFYTSGGMAPMGYSMCCAYGACFAGGSKTPVFAITGDGGFQISMQSLMILSQYKLPVKVIVLNNHSLGMITQFQDLYFDSQYEGTTKESGYRVPELSPIAEAYSLEYHLIDEKRMKDLKDMKKILTSSGPALIEFDLGDKTVVSPKLQVDTPLEDLHPKLERDELKKAMLIDLDKDGKK
jgi:acetolactate synthase I/II/III large subunit